MERQGWGYCLVHVHSPTIRTSNSSICIYQVAQATTGKEMEKQWVKSCTVMSMMEFKVLKVVLYVNDGICVGATKQATSQAARARFVINEEKSDFEPRQRVTWFEFSLELNQGNVSGMDLHILLFTTLKQYIPRSGSPNEADLFGGSIAE